MPQGAIIQHGFESFRRAVMHPDCGPVQISEMQKAFFAGALTLLTAVSQLGEDDVPEEVGVQVLDRLWAEVKSFANNLPDNGAGGLTDEPMLRKGDPHA